MQVSLTSPRHNTTIYKQDWLTIIQQHTLAFSFSVSYYVYVNERNYSARIHKKTKQEWLSRPNTGDNKMKIDVYEIYEFGGFPITCQVKEIVDGESYTVFCNHDGAVRQNNIHDIYNDFTGAHATYSTQDLICDKCEAYMLENDSSWENSPWAGKHV